MADGLANSSSSQNNFRLPPEPSPLSSIDENEDSFVILYNDSDIIREITSEQISSNAAHCSANEGSTDQNASDIPSVTTLPSDLNSGEFRDRVLEMMKENIFLKERFSENNKIMNVQHENIVALEQYYHEAQEQKKFIEMQQKEIRYLNDELEQLRNIKAMQDGEILALKEKTVPKPSEDRSIVKSLECAKKENAMLRKENQNLTLGLRQLRSIKDTQEKELNEVKQILFELQEQGEVTEELEVAKKEAKELKMKLAELESADEEKEKTLNEEIERLRSELRLAEQRPSADDLVRIEKELKSAKVMLMQSEQNNMVAESHIEALSQEIIRLREELDKMQWQADQVYTLKAQLTVYENDFEMEKRSKRMVKFENMKLLEEVENLRTCCRDLQEEIIALREAGPPRRTENVPPPHTEDIIEVEQTVMLCPICAFGFNRVEALQNHVERCLTNPSDSN